MPLRNASKEGSMKDLFAKTCNLTNLINSIKYNTQ